MGARDEFGGCRPPGGLRAWTWLPAAWQLGSRRDARRRFRQHPRYSWPGRWVDAPLLDALGSGNGDPPVAGRRQLAHRARASSSSSPTGSGLHGLCVPVIMAKADVAATAWWLGQPSGATVLPVAVASCGCPASSTLAGGPQDGAAPSARRAAGIHLNRAPEMKPDAERAESSSNLWCRWLALLSAVAVALAARGFAAGHLDRLRHAARAGAKPARIALVLRGRICAGLGFASLAGLPWLAMACTMFCALLAGLVESGCPRPASVSGPLAWAEGLTLLLAALACRPCCNWPRCRRRASSGATWRCAGLAGRAGPGRGGLCGPAAGAVSSDPAAGP